MTAGLFRQHTSRTADPQLHTHAVLSSKVQDPTGKWLSLDARFLKYQQMTIGWIYDAALRTELTARLGVAWKALDGGQADLACVSETARDLFSSRTAQVEAKLDELIERWSNEHDGEEPDVLTIAKLERAAARTSRPSKQHTVDGAALHGLWVDQTTRAGIDRDDLTAAGLTDASADRSEVDLAALVVEALRRTEEESATWLRADIARHLATLLPPAATRTATETIEMIDRLADVAEQRCLDLAPIHESGPVRRDGRPVAEHVTDRRLTTPAVLAQEQGIQKWARVSAHPTEELTGDLQADAATAMASYADLVVVVGPAGAGKTHTTARAVASLTDQGRPVVGLAPSGKAADVLARETGCRAQTLAAFLARHNGLSRRESLRSGTTILLDEAAMASTQDLANLVALAKQRWWRIVAVGDPAQLPAVGRGGTFAHWCETLPHHRLETPRRFDAPWEADASLGLRAGEPDAAAVYAEHQRLHATHPALLARQIALAHRRQIDRDRTVAITTTTTEMARKINEAIQIRQGHTRNEWKAELADGTRVYAGDQIATRRNNADLTTDMGHRSATATPGPSRR